MEGSKRIIIDPGHWHLFDHVERNLAGIGVSLYLIDLVIITHGHPDHLEGVRRFPRATHFAMNEYEYRLIRSLGGDYMNIPTPAFFLKEGDFVAGDIELKIIETPGHSPGSLCLYWPKEKALVSGDVIFKDGIGRTDLPGGSGGLLKESIEKLARLDVKFLLPGHGEAILGQEAVRNNFETVKRYWFSVLQ